MTVAKKPIQAKTKAVKKVAAKKSTQGAGAKVKNVYFGGIDGDAIYKKLNESTMSRIAHHTAALKQKIDDAISEAKAINDRAAGRLEIKLSARELEGYDYLSDENIDKLNSSIGDLLAKRIADTFVSSMKALEALLMAKNMMNLVGDDMLKLGLFGLLDAFTHLGIAQYCASDKYLKDGLDDLKASAIESKVQDLAPQLKKAEKFTKKPNTERDDYIRQLKKQYFGVLTHEAIFKKADKKIIGDLKFTRFKNIK